MLRQLARLTRPLPAAGPDALVVAVYSDLNDEPIVARESGMEGVACVDDAARLLDVLCDVWAATRLPWIERWARGMLDFVLWMQEADGRWINFVYDWEGRRNHHGLTSNVGENFWHARALRATTNAWLTFGDERAERALHLGLDHAVTKDAPPDVRALHLEMARRLVRDAGKTLLLPAIRRWADEIASCRIDGMLMNSPFERGVPHLWAHTQEGVLVDAAELLEDPSLLDLAITSAERLLVPTVESGFGGASSTPYDVSSTLFSLDRLLAATGDPAWAALAADARGWFGERNASGRPVYDAGRGRVADGIDGDRLNANSGAEANIEGANALPAVAIDVAGNMAPPFPG